METKTAVKQLNMGNEFLQVEASVVKMKKLSLNLPEIGRFKECKVSVCLISDKLGILWSRIVAEDEMMNNQILLELDSFFQDTEIKSTQRYKIGITVEDSTGMQQFELVNKEFQPKKRKSKDRKYNNIKYYLPRIELDRLKENGQILLPYFQPATGSLRIVVLEEELELREQYAAHLKKLNIKKNILSFTAIREVEGYEVKQVYFRYRSKLEDRKAECEFQQKPLSNGKEEIKGTIELDKISFLQIFWDMYFLVEKDGREFEIKVKHREKYLKGKFFLFDTAYYSADGYVVYPYFAKDGGLVLHYREKSKYDLVGTRIKEGVALMIYFLTKPYWDKKKIWLVFEKFSVMAQDNGFYFFKYCMEQLPESEKKRIYYIIDKSASDYQNVKQYDKQVLSFMSLKHMIYYKAAKLYVSSDTKNHGYAWRSKYSILKSTVRKTKICFLQHGVTAFKRVHPLFGKSGSSPMSYFVATSKFEQDILFENFGYTREELPITGFARWDVLEDKEDKSARQILLMPTWRSWIEEVDDEVFVASDYYKNYTALLNNQELAKQLEEKNVKLIFYIHPKFRDYMNQFEIVNKQVELVPFGTQPLNELMMKCSMLITDYSSVAWDVYYLGKPVVFYHFDLDKYETTHGSYMDLRKDLFGERAETLESLLPILSEYIQNEFQEKEQYQKMRDTYFAYRDNNNSKRTYDYLKKIMK